MQKLIFGQYHNNLVQCNTQFETRVGGWGGMYKVGEGGGYIGGKCCKEGKQLCFEKHHLQPLNCVACIHDRKEQI